MQRHLIHLENHYQDLAKEITNNTTDSPEALYEVHGERLNHYQLLSEVISNLSNCEQLEGMISIAAYLTAFELKHFRAINYNCIPEMPNEFAGELLYANNEIALCRVTSFKYQGFGLIILVTKHQYSFDFESNTDFVLGHNYWINGVMSL